jgi:hypothetical protein
VNAPTILGAVAVVLAAVVAAFAGLRISQRTTKSNEATASVATAVSAFDLLQRGQRAEMNRMQGQLDVVRPALAASSLALAAAEALVVFLRASLAAAEAAGELKAAEIVRLHGLIDSLELSIKAMREALGKVPA